MVRQHTSHVAARHAATRRPQCHPERPRQTPLDRLPTRDPRSTRGAMRRCATTPRRFAHTPTSCCCAAGVRDDIAADVAADPGRRRPDGTYDARARAARRLSRRARAGQDGASRAHRAIVHAATAAQTWDGAAPAGPVAHVARARRGDGDGGCARHRHGRHPPLASHRLPRRVPEARDRSRRDGAHPLQRSVEPQRRAVRRRHVGVHAESARRRHPDVRRSDPDRRVGELHDQRHDEPAAQGRRIARASVGAGRATAIATRDPAVLFQRAEGDAAAARRPRSRSQGLRARTARSRR